MWRNVHLPSSLYYLPRRIHVYSTAAAVYVLLKTTQLLNRLLRRSDSAIEATWTRSNTTAARLILRTATARRGLWIKCCQYIAARSDALPEEYSIVLSKSLDDCPPTPARLVRELVDAQLAMSTAGLQFKERNGRAPTVSDLFLKFNAAAPVASASIAQVHTATEMATGRNVVLKVQHPGVRPMLLQDLADLKTLLRWVAGAEPKFDMRPVLDAWIDMVPLETDFDHEQSNLQAVRESLANAPPNLASTAYIPEPLPQYSTDKLFVMEFIDGCRISDILKMDPDGPVNREHIITEISKSFGTQLFLGNTFSGDPHPGNFLIHRIQEGGQPVLLDFGICVEVSKELRVGFARLILAACFNDSYSLVQALTSVGVNLNRADPTASLDVIKFLFRTTAPRDQSLNEQKSFIKDLENRGKEIKQNEIENPIMDAKSAKPEILNANKETMFKSRTPMDSFPGHLVFFFRSLGMLRGLAAAMEVRHSYLSILRPFAEHSLLVDCPEQERLVSPVYRPITCKGRLASRAGKILEVLFEKMYAADMMIGMQVAVYKKDELVLDMSAGRKGRNNPRPVTPDTVFNSFSSTKGLTSILFASLQDEYKVEYDDLVTKYWPEYGQCGKENTTVGHILSHRAGLAVSLPDDMTMPRLLDDWKGIIKYYETAVPNHEPGTQMEYHALSFGWLVAGLIMKITGKSYQEHLQELAKKLQIDDECFCGTLPIEMLPDVPESRVASLSSFVFQDLEDGPMAKIAERMKHNSDVKKTSSDTLDKDSASTIHTNAAKDSFEKTADDMGDLEGRTTRILKNINFSRNGGGRLPTYLMDLNFYNHPALRAGFVPSANGHFSARALAKLYAIIANDGVLGNERFLSTNRVERMQAKMCSFEHRGQRAWAAGLTLYDALEKNGRKRPEAVIGHGGIGGSFAFAIPSERFAMAVTLNKLNAMSVSAAVIVAATCRAFGVPTPEWYYLFAERALKSVKEDGLDSIGDESAIIERMLSGGTDDDVMKILIG